MTNEKIKFFVSLLLLLLIKGIGVSAKEIKDTLYSGHGDRVIITYSQTMSGGQLGIRFNNVQKKLSEGNLKKYKKLDEVAVVIFDRTGNFHDLKFDGMATSAFMVPSDVHYNSSADGYFLLKDNPSLQFSITSENSEISIPVYLAHYEGKRHYKVFAQCGKMRIKAKKASKPAGGSVNVNTEAVPGQQGEVVISSEELVDAGISPADEAAIRINTVRDLLEKANKVPFSEELTHEAAMLRELRMKVTDEAVVKQINDALSAYDNKKQQLEQQNDASQQAAAAAAQQAQARQDSIQAAQAAESSKDKKNMMWLIGGLGGFFALFMGGKQIMQSIKNNKMQKMQQQMQQQMMRNIQDMANKANPMAQMGNPLQGAPGPLEQMGRQMQQKAQAEVQQQINRQVQQANQQINNATDKLRTPTAGASPQPVQPEQSTGRAMSEESRMAKERLRSILAGRKGQAPGTELTSAETDVAPKISITPGRKPSLNDQIPTKYKRLQKVKKPEDKK